MALLLWQEATQAQLIERSYGSKSQSMGGIGILNNNGFEVINNPALLADGKENSLSFFQELPFLQKDLSISALSYQRKLSSLSAGFSLVQSGNTYFKQQLISAALGKKLSEHLFLGAAMHYQMSYQYQSKPIGYLMASLGALVRLKKYWTFSLVMQNITASTYQLEAKPSPTTQLRFGCAYLLNDKLQFLAEQEQILGQKGKLKLGMVIRFEPNFECYLGWNIHTHGFAFGCAYQKQHTRILIGASVHPVLGLSPGIEVNFLPLSRKK